MPDLDKVRPGNRSIFDKHAHVIIIRSATDVVGKKFRSADNYPTGLLARMNPDMAWSISYG